MFAIKIFEIEYVSPPGGADAFRPKGLRIIYFSPFVTWALSTLSNAALGTTIEMVLVAR